MANAINIVDEGDKRKKLLMVQVVWGSDIPFCLKWAS